MQTKKSFLPPSAILLIFVTVSLALLAWKFLAASNGNEWLVLLVGNLVLFISTGLSFYLCQRALYHSNIHAFVRMVYSGMLIKMGICLAAALVYIFASGSEVNRTGVLGFFALYCIYTFTEVKILMRLSKQQKNG